MNRSSGTIPFIGLRMQASSTQELSKLRILHLPGMVMLEYSDKHLAAGHMHEALAW
jgi:hypothetical protein